MNRISAALATLALCVSSCAQSDNVATFTIELATSMAGSDCSATEEPLPVDVACISVSLCERVGSVCNPEPLYRTDSDHSGPGSESVRLGRLASASFSLDARSGVTPHELSVVAYSNAGTVVATGVAHDIVLDGSPVRVRLQRANQWACGPKHADGSSRLLPRALHAATAMPNGDVLIYGGVTGESIAVAGFASGAQGASLERSIEVYDASEDRFYDVSVSDPSGFGRVFFASELASASDDAPPYRIHVFGGYVIATGAVLRVDAAQSNAANSTGLPFVPTADAMPAESVTLSYNPNDHSVALSPLGGTGGYVSGFPAVSGFLNDDNPSLLVLGAGAFTGATSMTTLMPEASWIDHSGAPTGSVPSTLMNGRLGGTSTIFPNAPGSALVWGGNIGAATLAEARASAGEIVRLTLSAIQVPGGNPDTEACTPGVSDAHFPEPTIFHTASPVHGGILLAGGLAVGSSTQCTMKGVLSTYNDIQPMTVVTLSGSTPAAFEVAPETWRASILHTATSLTEAEGSPEGVLLVGGACRGADPALTTLGQVGIVTGTTPDSFAYTAIAPLQVARFGHATARLPGGRVLVTGGFTREMVGSTASLRALDSSEVIQLGVSEPNLAGANCADVAFSSM